eukprot:scaffold5385_cov152-Amphora_coffeaeformis.AAC.2
MASSSDKKRSADEISGSDTELLQEIDHKNQEILRLNEEILRLNNEMKQVKGKLDLHETKNAVASESEDEWSDDEDGGSVCDGSFFSKKYFLLKQYKQENGDCKVPQKHPALGTWIMNKRAAFKSNKLPQDQIDKLNKLGFFWGKGFPEPPSWEDRFKELAQYKENFGHCNVPISTDPSVMMSDLAKWVWEQCKQGKRLQKMKASDMTLDQYKLLNDMGFKWNARTSRHYS